MHTLFLYLSLVMGMGSAHAQSITGSSDAQARVLFENGKMLYDEGRYEDAIAAFERAYSLSPDRTLLLFNIANAKERVGDWYGALDALNRYRAFAPIAERPTLERRIRSIEARLAQTQVILPPVEPEPVRVLIPVTPIPQDLDLEPEPATRWHMGTGPVVMYSLAGLGTVAGSVFAFQAESARQEAQTFCSKGDAVFCPSSARSALNRDRVFSWLTDGSFGLAGASALTGTIIMVVANGRASQAQAWTVAPTGSGLGLEGRF